MVFLPDLNNQFNHAVEMEIDLNQAQQEEDQQEVIFNPIQPVNHDGDYLELNDVVNGEQAVEEIEIQQPEVPQPPEVVH